jgi:large repetitive protein
MLLVAGQLFGGPVISSFSPTFGASSDPSYIYIYGSGFSPGTLVVKFNGVTATAQATTSTQIHTSVPAGATNGPNPIFVSVAGVGTYSADDFTVIGPGPYISDFSPNVGSGGTAVTISGAHFWNPVTVKFTGANPFNTNATSLTQFTVNAPAGITSGPISVTTSNITYTSVSNFYVPPVVTGFSPAAGRAGTNVIITGANFLGATAVRFGTLDAASFNVLSNGAIQASVPANATTGRIRVIEPAGSAFSAGNFVVQPTITGFSPGFGPIGTSVTILGANFNVGTPVVKFNGTSALAVSGVTFNLLTAVVPNGATSGPITVTTTDGTAISATNFYLPARITGFTPNHSGPGTTIKITGENFTNAMAVNFSGAPAAAFFVTNNTTIGAIVPFGVLSGPISVTTPAGTTNSSSRFFGPPFISVFYPTHGLPGTNVTLTGQNFFDASAVAFNGSNAVFSVVNNTTITTTVPNGAQTGPVTVVAPAGTNTTTENFVLDYTADVRVTVTDSPDPVTVMSNLTYSIVVMNNGPFPAAGVTLSDSLPESVALKSASTTAGSLNVNANSVTGDFGQINYGDSVTVTLVVVPQAAGTIINTVSVASLYNDPLPSNNMAINTTVVEPLALLSIQQTALDTVRVSWPAGLSNYVLQFKPLLATTNYWSNVTTVPFISSNENLVIETNLGTMKYFRLKR